MRKLFFIIIAASITANIYAVEFSGQTVGSLNFISGDSNIDDPSTERVLMGGNVAGRVRLEAQMEKDNFGAWARFNATVADDGNISGAGYIFYRPHKYLDFFITRKPANNGHWALDGNALGSFYGFSREVIVADYHSYNGSFSPQIPRFNNAFYPGFTNGAFLAFKYKDLGMNLGLPVFERDTFANTMQSLTFQINYKLGNFGLIGFTYLGGVNDDEFWNDSPAMFLYFNIKKIGNATLDFGLGYMLPEENTRGTETRSYPLSFGFAAFFDREKVDLKLRLLVSALGKTESGVISGNSPIDIVTDVLPSISFNRSVMGYLNAGFHLRFLETGDFTVLWHVNPYVVFGNMSTAAFYAGIRFDNRGGDTKILYWSVPIGLSLNF